MFEAEDSYEYEYDNNDYGEDEEDIEIENTYFEADGMIFPLENNF